MGDSTLWLIGVNGYSYSATFCIGTFLANSKDPPSRMAGGARAALGSATCSRCGGQGSVMMKERPAIPYCYAYASDMTVDV